MSSHPPGTLCLGKRGSKEHLDFYFFRRPVTTSGVTSGPSKPGV